MERRFVIIDGNSLLNRAYYAMQRTMMTKEGLYTNGVYGFLNMLAKIQKDYEPGYLAVTFDRKAPTFRHIEYSEYKAGRKKMPPELAMQMPILKEVLAAMNIRMLEMDGFEADDIIGTLARVSEGEGLEPLIITGDRDELQLATDVVKVIITKKGTTDFELYDRNAMIEKYGFPPERFVDYKGLMGDQSDNIPGIPGVGEKTAQKLLIEFGSLEALLESTEKIENEKLRAKIEDGRQLAVMSKKLATIDSNVPISIELEHFKSIEPDYNELINIYIKLEFNSFLKNLKKPEKIASENKPIESRTVNKLMIDSKSDFDLFKKSAFDSGSITIKVFNDYNHSDVPEIFGIGAMSGNDCYCIRGSDKWAVKGFFEILAEKMPKITGHNLISDYYALLANGYIGGFNTSFDTEVALYVLDPGRSRYEISTNSNEHAQMDLFADPDEQYLEDAVNWCCTVESLKNDLAGKIDEEGLGKVYYEIELPLVEVLADMECRGFKADKEVLLNSGHEISGLLEILSNDIFRYAGEEFNINSPQQLGNILFEKLGLPAGKKLKTGYSTNAEVLEKLLGKHPMIEAILEYRFLAKLKGTYIEGLIPLIHKDGRIHAHFQQTVTATGRLSCTEPNLQNIPVRREEGRKIRKAFIAGGDGCCLVGADYSQIELRVLAHMSGDPELIAAFNGGEDIHKLTAARVLGIPEGEVTTAQRNGAKAVNFGVIYGMSGFGLSTELNITRKEAEKYIEEYFKKYTSVKKYMDEQVAIAKRDGYVRTITGRKRAIPEIRASAFMVRQFGERLAMNSPIQGSAADIIKIAMVNVYNALRNEELKSKLILQVHDELIIETVKEETEKVKKLLENNMENAMALKVKLTAGLSEGLNWYELK